MKTLTNLEQLAIQDYYEIIMRGKHPGLDNEDKEWFFRRFQIEDQYPYYKEDVILVSKNQIFGILDQMNTIESACSICSASFSFTEDLPYCSLCLTIIGKDNVYYSTQVLQELLELDDSGNLYKILKVWVSSNNDFKEITSIFDFYIINYNEILATNNSKSIRKLSLANIARNQSNLKERRDLPWST